MSTFRLPRLRLMQESQLGEDSWHSLLISMLRGLAALQVAAAHIRAGFYPGLRELENPALWYQGLAFFTGFAHHAVLVFFLISGWLVGGSLLNKLGKPDAIRLYAIDRVTRLWTVLIPTFVLILAFGIVSGQLDPRSVDFSASNPYSASAFAGNLAGVQKILVPTYGTNFPLWSLSNESWYYLMFPLMVLAAGTGRRALPLAALALCAILLPFALVLYFSIWLLGAAFSRVRIECGVATRVVLAASALGLAVYFRLFGINDDMQVASFPQDLLMGVVFMLFLSSTIVRPAASSTWVAPLRKGADFLSSFSFTLYVVHVPVLDMLRWLGQHLLGRTMLDPGSPADLGVFFAILAIVIMFSYGFYLMFESRTYQIRRWVKGVLTDRKGATVAAVVSK